MIAMQRQIIVIEGNHTNCTRVALALTHNLHTLLLETPKKAHQYLGQEFDAIIFNSFGIDESEQFDPNAFGAITGTIRSSGYLLLLKPKNWSKHSLFITRFDGLLHQYHNIRFIYSDSTECLTTSLSLPPLSQRETHTTGDQEIAIKAIIRVVKGHRRRPLLIRADRGRGKSAALGLAATQLYQQGCEDIIVCAPSRKVAAVVFQYAQSTPLKFYSPDELQLQKPKTDLLLIDEAAAIPIPLLLDFVKHYSRIVFATTQHGYEGSGRGFALTFKKALNKISPNWKSYELTTPIRWEADDKLEQFVFQTLLLNAEAASIELITEATLENIQFKFIPKELLLQNEEQLKEIFGLLVSAHYQTKPSDFKQMLDDQNISIFVLSYQQHIIAVSLVIKEGNIDKDLAFKIFEGTRRIKGHLVAQALAANVGLQNAPCLQGQRIIRIAIHPSLQQKGFGSHLLQCIEKRIHADYLSTSFGTSLPLLKFWKKAGYSPVYLGMKRDASSGAHSVIMLKAKHQNSKKMLKTAQQSFTRSFPHLLSDPFRNLEGDISLELFSSNNNIVLSQEEENIINAFAKGQRGYENSLYAIWKLVLKNLGSKKSLIQDEIDIILYKVLQKHCWKTCSKKGSPLISGKKNALKLLRKAISKLQ